MYKLIKYTDEYKTCWNEFVKEVNGTVFHLIEWKEVLEEAFGYKGLYYLVVDETGKIAGLIPIAAGRDLLLRRVGASLPFVNYMDICCRDGDTFKYIAGELVKLQDSLGLKQIEMRLKQQELYEITAVLHDNNYTLIIPLDGNEEQVLSYSSGNNRNHVRKAYKNNYFSISFDKANLPEFYKIYCRTMKRLGSPAPDFKFFKGTMEKLPSNTVLLTVTDNESGSIVGGMFLFISGDTLYYQWGGSLPEYNRKYVNNFMYWEAVRFGLRNGCKQLDLGRSPFESGTYKFKQQWGAVPYKLKYYIIGNNLSGAEINRDNLSMFVSIWKILPNLITDFVGKIIIKYVLP